ncbi:probable splicing factor YJU2B [Osmerus eperlanus]|uniref:probable splicing factor YJU2B n=1 Tax=Osmerus eperlanus TaxID=29151 RepID=UPI002E11C3FE
MGERKGVNKYYPPDFDPAKHGSLNGYHNTHPLRERAKKLSQGILVIRFEMPYNIWCDGCGNHIGMGVRYNAEKKKMGNYYTTPIYRFRMKCHLCVNYIEMQTDPATCDYLIISGARRKEERWDMADNEQILTTERTDKEKLETDPMFKLDHGGKDKEKLRAALPSLSQIQEHQEGWRDDFQLNSTLRRKFRTEKRVMADEEEKDNAVRKRMNLSIPLVPEKEEDKKLAALLTYTAPDSYDDRQHIKRKEISTRSWFGSPSLPQGGAAGSLLHKLGLQGKGAAVAKALGPSPATSSSLIRRRTEGAWSRPRATVTRRKSDPGTQGRESGADRGKDLGVAHRTDASDSDDASRTRGLEIAEVNGRARPAGREETTEEEDGAVSLKGEDCGTVEEQGSSLARLKSLVADYSDSESDPGQ